MDPRAGADLAALAKVVARQRAEMERLRDLAATSAVLERAKGVLMALTGCTPDAAHEELRQRAKDGQRTLLEQCWLTLGALPSKEQPPAPPSAPPAAGPWTMAPAGTAELAEVLAQVGRDMVHVGSPHELAGCLLDHLGREIGADAVMLYERLPEGGLGLIGHAGVDPTLAAQWRHVPPVAGVAPLEAVRTGEPSWLEDLPADRSRYLLIGDPPERWLSRAWLPVPAGDTASVAFGVLRRRAGAFEPRERELLRAVARLCAGRLRAFDGPQEGTAAAVSQTVQAVFDVLPGAVILLSPLRTASGEIEDYRIDAATPDAVDVFGRTGRDMVGRHVLESYPSVAGEPLWQGYQRALATGVPFEGEPFAYQDVVGEVTVTATYSVRAAALGESLVVSWLRHDSMDRQEQRLSDVQRLGNLGWANWNLITQEISWAAQTYAVLGLRSGEEPVRLEQLPGLAVPEDAGPLAHAIAELVSHGHPFDVPFRMDTPGAGVRHLRMVAEAVSAPEGTPVEVHGFVQDLTAQRSAELALVESERAMLLQRGILQAERALAARLQHALLPLPSKPARLAGLRVEVAYLPAQSGIHVGGDWFSAIELPDHEALFVVGDVAGHGLDAVATMAQLRFTAKGMVSTGSSLTGALARLNQLLLHSRDSQTTATMVLARYDPERHVLAWAQAGHPPPLLVRGGEVRYLDRPGGILLGATGAPVYELMELELQPGDRLLLYTDGLVERPAEGLDAGFERLAEAVRAHACGESGSLEALLASMLADERRDDVCVVDIRMPVDTALEEAAADEADG
ncbi:SpoIIE family protein phosphatase [Streptomyces actinomycinicus]|uniref:SpoIIE family protein phosphatase n=1 Tax=Streptomyces actinomycinicus TaxID=1695166 RepID=A0A937ELB0_9ACTN|nr:SpoIIE family protein phosphatase [Streptomyces actinomycinicus]MBL1084360.1 SpoIIE family protein phosphatase [Streptomyces actinomycinicus]